MNLENIKKQLQNKQLRSAAVDILVYPNKDYVIIPRGRSAEKKWIGAKVLDYKEKGNLNSEDSAQIDNKIIQALDVCCSFAEKGIEPTDKNVEAKFYQEGTKNDFKDYYYVSLIFFANNDTVRVNSLRPVDKKGSEWTAKEDTMTEVSSSDVDSVYNILKKYINVQCR